jgi:hypothetical protein
MQKPFNPAILHALGNTLGSDVIEADQASLHRIAGSEARQRCADLKLAARIVGLATASGAVLDDREVLRAMNLTMERLVLLRQVGLERVGVKKNSPDYPAVFNAVTEIMLDAVTDEWKWKQANEDAGSLSPGVIGNLFDIAVRSHPERFEALPSMDIDLTMVRRLAVITIIPRVYGLLNFFDFFQRDIQGMLGEIVQSIADMAESYAREISAKMPAFAVQIVLQRLYGESAALMGEVYKAAAYREVERLSSMPEYERSILLARCDRLGGLPWDHVLAEHREAMGRMMKLANVIAEAA